MGERYAAGAAGARANDAAVAALTAQPDDPRAVLFRRFPRPVNPAPFLRRLTSALYLAGQDWCRDESIRQVATVEDGEPNEPLCLSPDELAPPDPGGVLVSLTRVHPALAGPLPRQGIAA